MILGIEIALLIYGIIALCNGTFSIGKNRKVMGGKARILGLICILPLPIAFAVGLGFGNVLAAQGQQFDNPIVRQTNVGLISFR